MKDLLLPLLHLAVTAAKLCRPGGVRAVIAENLLLKQQLIVLRRSRQRAPNLRVGDRLLCGFGALFLSPGRIRKVAIGRRPSTLLTCHQALVRGKYRRLFSSSARPKKPGPTGPSESLIRAIVELNSRNPRFGCPRIARIISQTFGVDIDKNVVHRVLAKRSRPAPGGTGHSWLSFVGHTTDSLWTVDLLRCASIVLQRDWVRVVMDQFTRRLVGVGVHRGPVDAPSLCRMCNAAIHGRGAPRHLSTDHDPLFEAHRWTANLRLLEIDEIDEIKTVPHVPPYGAKKRPSLQVVSQHVPLTVGEVVLTHQLPVDPQRCGLGEGDFRRLPRRDGKYLCVGRQVRDDEDVTPLEGPLAHQARGRGRRTWRPTERTAGARMVPPGEGNEARGDGRRGVGVSHSTAEAGKLSPRDPVEGKGHRQVAPVEGTTANTPRLGPVSTSRQRIAELARPAVGMAVAIAWLPGPAGTRRRVAKLSVEEPDAAEPARPDLWGAKVSNDPGLPRPPATPPTRRGALLRGAASNEPKGRGGARGGGVGRVGPLAGWHRLRLLRQIGDQLVPGVEQLLLVDDVVAVEDGAALVPGQEHGDALGDVRADQVAGGGTPTIVEEASRHPRPPDRRCATPCASGEWECRRGGRPAGCRGRGVPAVAPGPRRWGARWGGCVPPTSSSALARAG